jgi:hypothetical protein
MFRSVLETVLTAEEVDIVIISGLSLSLAGPIARRMANSSLHSLMASAVAESAQVPLDIRQKTHRPLVMVLPVESLAAEDTEAEEGRRKVASRYLAGGIPVFLTLERAAKALGNVIGYYRRQKTIASSG